MKPLRYIAYVRKSTEDEEKQVLSKEAQADKIKERFPDAKIVAFLDESKSAFEPDKRVVFKRVLEMLDKGEADGIIAWHPDRLSRNEVDASAITWRIRQGIIKDLKFASFSFDNSPEGLMMLQMTMSQSQYFSAKLSKDVKRGNEKKRQLGGLTGLAPEGYLNDRLHKTVVKDPVRFKLIRQAFDLFLTGEYSVQAILRIMNDDWKYKTVKRSKIGGKSMSRSTLYHMFRNVRYAGLVPDPYDPERFYKASFPPMITPDEYDRVQVLLGTKGCPRLASRKQFALRGFIKCGECGCMITAQSKAKKLKNGDVKLHSYYHCTGKRQGCSQIKGFGYKREGELFDELVELLDQYELTSRLNEWGLKALKQLADKEADERSTVQTMQNNSIESVQQQLDRLLGLATEGFIDKQTYRNKHDALMAELTDLQTLQADTANKANNWYEFAVETFEKLVDANERFAAGDIATKKEILLAIGQNPVLLNGKLEITPNGWLEPIQKNAKLFRAELERVRTLPQQIQKASEEALSLKWYSRMCEVRTMII